ncbi:MAG TPA: nucleoside deaminase [Chitinophagales bacterium]|nr:nucleoside deaminase [Chitinophagales bacterium]
MINIDEYFMREALKQATYALQENEIPIGAVIVYNDKIIARAYNQVEKLKDVTAHAEMIAITSASDYVGGKFLQDCSLYVTLEPCIMCVGAIRLARFKKVVFGTHDHRHLMPERWDTLLPKTEIYKNVLAQESQALLDQFFNAKRTLNA